MVPVVTVAPMLRRWLPASILPERWNTGNSNLLSDLGLAIPYVKQHGVAYGTEQLTTASQSKPGWKQHSQAQIRNPNVDFGIFTSTPIATLHWTLGSGLLFHGSTDSSNDFVV
ncbi:hypothetical protein CIB48_g2030 [Xylaria polymorpha]|nr:hypothetical protein CIB48_g2030 [Xylaria polymorpha]